MVRRMASLLRAWPSLNTGAWIVRWFFELRAPICSSSSKNHQRFPGSYFELGRPNKKWRPKQQWHTKKKSTRTKQLKSCDFDSRVLLLNRFNGFTLTAMRRGILDTAFLYSSLNSIYGSVLYQVATNCKKKGSLSMFGFWVRVWNHRGVLCFIFLVFFLFRVKMYSI